MRLHHLPLFLLLPLVGCVVTKDAKSIVGMPDLPASAVATLRESDHTFLRSVDGRRVPGRGWLTTNLTVYHQYFVPAGRHTVFFTYDASEVHGLRGGSAALPVTLVAGHTYTFVANVDTFYFIFGGATTADWHPVLIDDATKQPATTPVPSATAPATRP